VPKQFALAPELQLNELESYHQDVEASLRLCFSPSAATFDARFVGKQMEEVKQELELRIAESDVRSTFFVLTSLEATFRVDFDVRCRKRGKDALSLYFREVERKHKRVASLDEDILEGWRRHEQLASSRLIRELRDAFKFRHWLAHGRHWTPKFPRKYDFRYVHLMADGIISEFPFEG
jgi:hypothetical protein